MRVQCHGFNGLYSDLWRGHLSGFGSSSLSGFGKQRLKDFQGWFPVPWASTRGKRCYQPRIWSKQWHTSIRRAWFIVTSNLRLGSSWWNNGRDHDARVKKDFLILFVVDDVDIVVHDVVIFLKLLLSSLKVHAGYQEASAFLPWAPAGWLAANKFPLLWLLSWMCYHERNWQKQVNALKWVVPAILCR